MSERERRLGENEAIYREVNERVRDLQERFGADGDRVGFVCECSRLACSERIDLTVAEYEAVRTEPTRFALKPGHELLEVESVVEEHDGYLVVEKLPGGPAEVAIRTA